MKKTGIIVAVFLLALILAVLFISSNSNDSNSSNNGVSVNSSGDVKVISIEASRFQYTPGEIHVKAGEKVRLVINNTDTPHGIAITDLGVSGIDSLEFTPQTPGTYEFKCPTMCGVGHRSMKGTLIVE